MISEKKAIIDGSTIHYILAGDILKQPLVFLHGWPGNIKRKERAIKELAKDFYVIAPEHPGLLRSEPLKRYANIFEQYADIAYQILVRENLDKTKCIIMGHSFGGPVAGAFAEKYKSNVRALIVTDSVMGGQKQDLYRKILLKYGKKIIILHLYLPNFLKKGGLKMAFRVVQDKKNKKEINELIKSRIEMIDDYCSRSYEAMKSGVNLLDRNYSKDLLIIMLWGNRDGEQFSWRGYSKGKDAKKLYEKFKVEGKKAEFLLVPGGHAILYQKPKKVIGEIKGALNKHSH